MCAFLSLIADQWSPLNPEGKKHYDRNFLLELQYATESLEKPDGLPQLPDVVLDTVSVVKLYKMFLLIILCVSLSAESTVPIFVVFIILLYAMFYFQPLMSRNPSQPSNSKGAQDFTPSYVVSIASLKVHE